MKVVGRTSETLMLTNALKSKRPELIAVYGRRRVGKTFLIRNIYKNDIQFEFSGIHRASMKHQLKNFHLTLSARLSGFPRPADWIEAFSLLSQFIDKLTSKKKKVIFIDEFPWLDTG